MNILLVALVAGVFSVQFVPLEAKTKDKKYPFMAELTNGTVPECFGVIIRKDAILTTARCIERIKPNIRVMYRTEETSYTRRVRATAYPKTVKVHEQWNSTSPHLHDIALVFLNETITTRFVETVKLETKEYYGKHVDGINKKSIKWLRYTNENYNSYSSYHGGHVESKHRCNTYCDMQNDYRVMCFVDTRNNNIFSDKQIGAPLLHKHLFHYKVMGLSSPAKSCKQSLMTWFTPVSLYKDWIQSQLATAV